MDRLWQRIAFTALLAAGLILFVWLLVAFLPPTP